MAIYGGHPINFIKEGLKVKTYESLRPLVVYSDSSITLPKGDNDVGYGNAIFLLSPNRDYGYRVIGSDFINSQKPGYRKFAIDFVYKDKIGFKKIAQNNTGEFKKEASELELPSHLSLVSNSNRASVLRQNRNIIVNMGEWMNLYFQYQAMGSIEKICDNFFTFIKKRISDTLMEDVGASESPYQKTLVIDIDQWFMNGEKLGLSKKQLINPIAILLTTLYKYPDKISSIYGIDIFLFSMSSHTMLSIPNDYLTNKNYSKIKSKILSMLSKSKIDYDTIDEKTALDERVIPSNKDVSQMSTDEVIVTMKAKEVQHHNEIRNVLINSLTKQLLGNTEDLTDDDDKSEIHTDDDEVNEIKQIADKYLDKHPELLTETDLSTAEKELSKEVKKRYIREFTPKYTDKQLKAIQEMQDKQDKTIGNLEDSISDVKSKIIDISDFSDAVSTKNTNLTQSRFVNFDKSYNEKKLENDIDQAVGIFANASRKVFVKEKQVEDTSTPVNLKKTYTYTLVDETGREMKISFDVPVIFDNHFMLINGNKKIIQHTLVLKPLVKTGPSTVQIVSNYQKMFIMRKGNIDIKTNALLRYLLANQDEYKVKTGNGMITNTKYKSTLEYDGIAKKITQFTVLGTRFILDTHIIDDLIEKKNIDPSGIDFDTQLIVGIDKNKEPIIMSIKDSFVDLVFSYMDPGTVNEIKNKGRKSNGGKLLMYTETKPLSSRVPLILLLYYFEGFTKVMEKAGIEYHIISKEDYSPKEIDLFEWGVTELQDGYIQWKRYPTENSLLMNGLNSLPMHLHSMEELDSKDTYMYLMTNIYKYANQAFNLDQYYDFMIDPITKEILHDMKLPEDLVSLCILANKMLKTNEGTPESDMRNMRLRSNEIIPYHIYQVITDAYRNYRKTQHRKRPQAITLKQDAVIRSLMKQPASAMNDASALNPVLEISKLRAVTYKGENGTNMDHAFKLDIRAYNETMLGIMGITTSPDSAVGINRQLTLEPNITSTRGYIEVSGAEHVHEKSSAELLSPSELLTPLGVQHDDPTRTSMAYKQSMYQLLVDDSDPALIGNGAEKVLPYHLSSDFISKAEDDGQVIENDGEYMVVKFKNGRFLTIDLTSQVRKNASAGFYILTEKVTNLKAGDKFKKNTVLAWEKRGFQKNGNASEVSMRLGPLVKIAIAPSWDIYEDSAPASKRASEKMTAPMIMPVEVSLNKDAYVSKIAKVGDWINAGESVITFDNYHEDEDVMALIASLREDMKESVIEDNSSRKVSHYTGEIVSIDVITTVPVEELSESLQKVVNDNWKKLKKRDKILNKYKNSDDMKYYKSGNLITSSTDPVEPDYRGKVRGKVVNEGVLITFYILFKDILSRGDKIAAEFALKSVTSHVFESGLEPYSESEPDEPIDLITAPLAISARKTPSIFPAMFGNKILIQAKKHLREWWNSN